MNLRQLSSAFPFALISQPGLGLSHAEFFTSFLPHRNLSQAQVSTNINMATGNLYLQDHVLNFPDMNGQIRFSYIYNSQAQDSCWQLATTKKIQQLENKKFISVREVDGRVINYHYDEKDNCYYAENYQGARPYLVFNEMQQAWEHHHPASNSLEIFNKNGDVIKHINRKR